MKSNCNQIGSVQVIDLLWKLGLVHRRKLAPTFKPNHGICCTCQDCGYVFDECVCSCNETIAAVEKLFEGGGAIDDKR